MAENENDATKTVVIAAAIVAVVGLGAYGIKKAIDYFQYNDKINQERYDDWFLELNELEAYQRELANKGTAPSDLDNQRLDTMVAAMKVKEEKWSNTSTWERIITDSTKWMQSLGITIAVGTLSAILGGLAAYILYRLFKKRPPSTPTYRDPKTGEEFTSEETFKAHMLEYQSQYSQTILNTAQAEFQSLPTWYQSEVSALSGYPAITSASLSWGTMAQQGIQVNWVLVAFAMVAVAATAGLVAPEAAALLILA